MICFSWSRPKLAISPGQSHLHHPVLCRHRRSRLQQTPLLRSAATGRHAGIPAPQPCCHSSSSRTGRARPALPSGTSLTATRKRSSSRARSTGSSRPAIRSTSPTLSSSATTRSSTAGTPASSSAPASTPTTTSSPTSRPSTSSSRCSTPSSATSASSTSSSTSTRSTPSSTRSSSPARSRRPASRSS